MSLSRNSLNTIRFLMRRYVISYSTAITLDDTEFVDDIEFAEYNPHALRWWVRSYSNLRQAPLRPRAKFVILVSLWFLLVYPPIISLTDPFLPLIGKMMSVGKLSNEINPTKSAKEDEQQLNGGTDDIERPTKFAKEDEQQLNGGTIEIGHDRGHESLPEKPLVLSRGEPEGYTCDDNYPWSGYGVGSEDCGLKYGYGNQVPQTPCGYGSDAMDLCESLFGYWPCLTRLKSENCGHHGVAACEQRQENQRIGAAYYLLYGNPTCNCGRH